MMKKWTLLLMIAAVALLIPLFSANVSAQEDASLSITKTADKTSASPGETITYTYIISNTGNVTISNISLEDDKLDLSGLDIPTSLSAGENITATATYTVVETDLQGPLMNTATVSGTDLNGTTFTDNATTSVPLTYLASIEVTKTATPNPASLGDTITYTYTITNTGDVTVNNLTLEDDMLNTIALDKTSLGQGDNVTATAEYTVIIDDFPEPIINTATASGTDPLDNPVTDIDTTSVDLNDYTRSIVVTKTASPNPASLGNTIIYTYTVTNTGQVTTDNLTLSDDKLGDISLDKTTLLPGETATSTGSYTHDVVVNDFPGPVTNTATTTGTDPLGNTVNDNATTEVTLNAYLASIEVTKDATPNPASPHEIITYTYVITNTGNVTIDNLALEDDMLGSIDLNTSTSLDPGESIAATATYPVTIDDLPGPIVNIATARGTDPLSNVVTDNASASVSLTINKTLLTKAEILKLSGVPGKGIDTAPGLQKPFNPKSQAAEHAGKKDRNNEEEQLQIRQRTENHSDADGQLKIRQKTKDLHKK